IPDESSSISYYKSINLNIKKGKSNHIEVIMTWKSKHPKIDSTSFRVDGKDYKQVVNDRVWPYQVFSGISMIPGTNRIVHADWVKKHKVLRIIENYPVLLSQGKNNMNSIKKLSLSDNGQILRLTVFHNYNKANKKTYVFQRGPSPKAYYMKIKKGWKVDGLLSKNAFLISLQGLANTDTAALYFIYPDEYDYNFTGILFDFYKNHIGYEFKRVSGLSKALSIFKDNINGYIIWDREARTSLNVAFTLAGLKKAVVVTSDMLPLVKEAGLREIADFRNKFRGKSDLEIYKWAYDHYWNQCNKDYIIWMGGVSGSKMKPGIADFGIAKGSFFTDLSTDPKDTLEYA